MNAVLPPCERTIAAGMPMLGAGAARCAHPALVLATSILASSLAFIDGSVVNVGLPAIGRALDGGGAGLSWIVNGYLLPLSALLLLGGAAGDRYGRKRLLTIGVTLFALASLLCAAAPSLAWLVGGRIAQGIGAALLMPNSLAILGANFDGEARGRAIGIWAAVGAAAGAVGPLVGGWLIDAVGWRTIFVINLPIAGVALVLAQRALPPESGGKPAALDLTGAALASVGLAALTWGLTVVTHGSDDRLMALLAMFGGLAILLVFLAAEKRAGERAMLPLTLFSSASFSGLNLMTFLLYGALGALMVLVPFVLIDAAHYSSTEAGAALLPLPVVIALASSTMGRIAGRIGARLPLTVGPLIVGAGCLLATRIGTGNYWTTTLPAMLVIAIGMAGAVAPLTTAVLASVGSAQTGLASGFNSAVARCGGLVATALMAAVLAAQGAALLQGFRLAALLCAGASFAAGACAFVYLRATPAA